MNETRGQRWFCVTGRLRVYGVFAERSRAVPGLVKWPRVSLNLGSVGIAHLQLWLQSGADYNMWQALTSAPLLRSEGRHFYWNGYLNHWKQRVEVLQLFRTCLICFIESSSVFNLFCVPCLSEWLISQFEPRCNQSLALSLSSRLCWLLSNWVHWRLHIPRPTAHSKFHFPSSALLLQDLHPSDFYPCSLLNKGGISYYPTATVAPQEELLRRIRRRIWALSRCDTVALKVNVPGQSGVIR